MKTLRWIVFLFFVLSASAVHAQWLYTDLHPSWSNFSWVMGVSAGDQVGYAMDSSGSHGVRWQFSPSTVVDLGGSSSYIWATDGTKQVGYKGSAAARWLGTPNSVVALRSGPYFSGPKATAIFGSSFGGNTWYRPPRTPFITSRAVFWPSLTANPIILPIPPQFEGSELYAMNSDYIGGSVSYDSAGFNVSHAAIWEGPNNAVLNVHPYGYYISTIRGISENVGVGWASENEYMEWGHAMVWDLWSGGSYSVHPGEHLSSVLWAISGFTAAGSFTDYNGYHHAAIWDLNSGTIIDLHQFLPSHYSASEARAIWVGSGCGGQQVGGWAYSEIDHETHAMLWYTPWC